MSGAAELSIGSGGLSVAGEARATSLEATAVSINTFGIALCVLGFFNSWGEGLPGFLSGTPPNGNASRYLVWCLDGPFIGTYLTGSQTSWASYTWTPAPVSATAQTPFWSPATQGIVAGNMQPGLAELGNTAALTTGVQACAWIPMSTGRTISELSVQVTTAGTGGTHGYLALADALTGAILGETADLGAGFDTAGLLTESLSAAVSCGGPNDGNGVIGIVLPVGTTGPKLAGFGNANSSLLNLGTKQWTTSGSGLTVPTALGSMAASANAFGMWAQ